MLSAGESTRMGQLKALLEWEGLPLVRYQAEQLLAAGVDRLIVVFGHRRDELAPLLPEDERVQVVVNPDYASGKVSSILAGVAAAPEDDHLLILGVDQPRPAVLVRTTLDAHLASEAAVTVAGNAGRRGHPVVFHPTLRGALLAISEQTEGLRSVLNAHAEAIQVVDTCSPLALVNLNTPADYDAARLLSSTSSARAGNQ